MPLGEGIPLGAASTCKDAGHAAPLRAGVNTAACGHRREDILTKP
jgi:hypothetical protein